VGETISLNIWTLESPKNVKIGVQCSDEEKMKFAKLLGEFQDVFAWSYEDLRGFDPSLIRHVIPIKEGIESVRKKQRPINPALEATVRGELEKSLKVGIAFLVRYPRWVSKLVPVPKVTDHISFFHPFHRDIMKDRFLPLNMEVIMQQVVRSEMMPLLVSFFCYNQIKVKGADAYKTTFIIDWGTVTYERMISRLPDASTTFTRPIQINLDELISIHIYLDDLIIYVKGLLITSGFQKLWLGRYKIAFVLYNNSYILKYLHERLLSYNTNDSHLKHYVGPT
jgi:hypothetical protein